MTTDTLVSIGTAALLLGVSVDTMRRWEIEGGSPRPAPRQPATLRLADIERLRTGGDAGPPSVPPRGRHGCYVVASRQEPGWVR